MKTLYDIAEKYDIQAEALDVVANELKAWGDRDVNGHTKNRVQKALGDDWVVSLQCISGMCNIKMYNRLLGYENSITAYLHQHGDIYVCKDIHEAVEKNIKDTRHHADMLRKGAERMRKDAEAYSALVADAVAFQADIKKKAEALAHKYGHDDVGGTYVSYETREQLKADGVHELVCDLLGREIDYIKTK